MVSRNSVPSEGLGWLTASGHLSQGAFEKPKKDEPNGTLPKYFVLAGIWKRDFIFWKEITYKYDPIL